MLPGEPARTPTMAQRIAGGVQRAWGMTLLSVGIAAGLGVFGVWLIGRGNWVFGVVALVAIIPITFTALFIRRAPCPRCDAAITVIGIDRCGSCGSYVTLVENRTVLVEPGFIAPLATFEVDIPLPVIPRLAWPEPGRCVVCGERAGTDETLDIQGERVLVPHCGDDQDGVSWSVGITSNANVAIVKLKFRSYSYYQAFLAANEVHTRQGMWR